MTTVLAPSPPPAAPARVRPGGGRPARRAITRWAWRLLRREWRQQALVLSLIGVAVAATTVGLGLVVNVQPSDQGLLGTANSRIDVANPGRHLAADIAAARRALGTVEVIDHETVPVPGSVSPVDVRAQDPHGVYGAAMLRLVSGAYPRGADEVAVTADVASTFRLTIGSNWSANGRTLRVVGIVENPKNLQDAFALVPPGKITAPSALTLLTDAAGPSLENFRPVGGSFVGTQSNGGTAAQRARIQALGVLLLATIGLAFVGLLAAAGFTVIAQRRLRALGMIAAVGATDRQIRRVVVANGAAVGVVGAVGGAFVGLAVWFALRPALEHLVGHRIDSMRIPWWAIIAATALAILTALAASWWPARSAARMPIIAALSGRPSPPRPAHHFALLGTLLGAAGFVMLVFSRAEHTVLIVSGILATTSGMLLLAPLGIRVLAAAARRAPVAIRLALRDLARYQARSGAALAAASLAVGIAATIAISAASQQAADHRASDGNLPANQLIVWLHGNPSSPGGPSESVLAAGAGAGAATGPNGAAIAGARRAADSIAQRVGAQHVLVLDAAVIPNRDVPAGAPPGADQAVLVHPISEQGHRGWSLVSTPIVATPAVAKFYGIPAAVLDAQADIVTARADLSSTQIATGARASSHPITVRILKQLPNYTSAPNTLITPQAIRTLGLGLQPVGWLVQTAQPLTAAQITDARGLAAAAGITIETRTAADQSLSRLRDDSTLVGVLIALGVLAMTVGLIRSEAAGDLRVLSASGASSHTRRALTAATAAALGLLGAVLGTAGAYLALVAWHWRHLSYLNHPPYADLAAILIGLPVAALIGGWLFGHAPASISRRPME